MTRSVLSSPADSSLEQLKQVAPPAIEKILLLHVHVTPDIHVYVYM